MDTVRIGMIGSGHMNQTYSHCVVNYNEGGVLVAVAGGTRTPKLAAEYDMEPEPDVETLLKRDDVDAVIVGTPHQVHAENVIAAAEHGKHVLVEKPMATSVADCDAMIAACERAGVTLSVIKSSRFGGVFERAKKIVDEGRIGQITMVQFNALWSIYRDEDWRRDYGPGQKKWTAVAESGGHFLDRGSHMMDMLRWLIGSDAVAVFGHSGSQMAEQWLSLTTTAQLQFANGATAQIWATHEMHEPRFPDSMYRAQIWGEKGLIEADRFGKLRVAIDGEWEDVYESPPTWSQGTRDNTLMSPARLESFYPQTQDFIDSIRHDRPPAVTGEDGRAAVEMVEAVYLSSLTGGSVRLPLPRAKGGFQFDGATVDRSLVPG